MTIFLFIIPLLAVVSAVFLYRHDGKKEFLKFDLVQFSYAFIIAPFLFIWLKTFVYFLLRTELGAGISSGELFIIDTVLSVLCFYIFSFVVIHSLTASFNRKMVNDPLHDLFAHSEFFHLWLSHLVMYIGAMLLITVIATINVFLPLNVQDVKGGIFILCGAGVVTGLFSFLTLILTDPRQDGANFTRLIKLFFGFFFLIHGILYFWLTPPFQLQMSVYWWSFMVFTTLVICSLFWYKSERAQTLFERISSKLGKKNWKLNIQLFKD